MWRRTSLGAYICRRTRDVASHGACRHLQLQRPAPQSAGVQQELRRPGHAGLWQHRGWMQGSSHEAALFRGQGLDTCAKSQEPLSFSLLGLGLDPKLKALDARPRPRPQKHRNASSKRAPRDRAGPLPAGPPGVITLTSRLRATLSQSR